MTDMILGWHFVADDGLLRDGQKVEAKTYSVDTQKRGLELCHWGLHASERAVDALSYTPGSIVCRVELSGEILRDTDKLCASTRRVLWMADATRTLHEFACWASEWILDKLEAESDFHADPRSRAAIAAKRAWLRGEITNQQLDAAGAAAYAAWDAAGAAAGVAAGVARDAAGAAAGAAGYAAWAAWDARDARDARVVLNDKLTEMLMALAPAEVTR